MVQEDREEEDLEIALTEKLFNARLERQLEKLRLKDQTSRQLSREVCSCYSGFTLFRRVVGTPILAEY